MLDKNYIIKNREAEEFAKISFDDILFEGTIYATLFCDEVNNITFVIDKEDAQDVVTLLWRNDSDYKEFKKQLENTQGIELSKQNIRINRYAESIAEKLANGVKLRVTDAADNSDMVECPECGMMNTKGSPYCMDCGADL